MFERGVKIGKKNPKKSSKNISYKAESNPVQTRASRMDLEKSLNKVSLFLNKSIVKSKNQLVGGEMLLFQPRTLEHEDLANSVQIENKQNS